MIPRDIETTEQWQVRYPTVTGETVRTGGERQMRWLANNVRELGPILEKRTITVGAWVEIDPDAPPAEETDEAD